MVSEDRRKTVLEKESETSKKKGKSTKSENESRNSESVVGHSKAQEEAERKEGEDEVPTQGAPGTPESPEIEKEGEKSEKKGKSMDYENESRSYVSVVGQIKAQDEVERKEGEDEEHIVSQSLAPRES